MDRIWEPNGSDGVDVESEASEGQIQSITEGSEIATLRRRVWGELEGAEEDLLRKSWRSDDRLG